MAAKVSYFKIGLFVVIAVTLALAGVAMLGAAAMFQESFEMVTYLDESAQGLAVGAPVMIRGVQVGEIAEIALADAKYDLPGTALDDEKSVQFRTLVVLTISITEERMVRRFQRLGGTGARELTQRLAELGWRVRKASSGITGPPFIELVDAGDAVVDVSNIPWKAQHDQQVYIPATHSFTTQVTTAVEKLADNLGKADVAGLITELKSVVEKFDGVAASLKDADISGLVASTKDLIDKRLSVTVDTLNKDLGPLLADLKSSTKDLPDTMEHVKSISAKVDSMAAAFDKRLPDLLDRADKIVQAVDKSVADDVAPALADIKKIAASLRKLTDEQVAPTLSNVREASGKVPDAVEQAGALLRRLRLSTSASLAKLEKTIDDLQQITGSIRRLTDQASRYPSHTLFGGPPPPALRRKGK